MDFQTYLQSSAQRIDQELDSFYQKWRQEVGEINPKLLPLLDLAIDASQGGKRLRGTLIKLGYEIALSSMSSSSLTGGSNNMDSRLHGNDNPEIYKVAVAYEIFQTAILAHDDIIDKSPLRRGKPTIYAALGGDHYATSQAICLGDIGFFLAFQIFAQSNFDPAKKSQAIEYFSKTMLDTGFGQMLDVELPKHSDTKEEDILMIYRYKTAWYTIVGPLEVGARLAGADQKLIDNIKVFGEALGIAFQIQDDILGVFGSEYALGKSITSDIEEGKLTLLYLKALENATPDQKDYLAKNYGQGSINNDQLTMIKKIFENTGSLKYTQDKAEKYVSEAKKVITDITDHTDHIKLLNEMADYLIKRSK